MLKIRKITDRVIGITEHGSDVELSYTANFYAYVGKNETTLVRIESKCPVVRLATEYSNLEINGAIPTSAEAAVTALLEFINFECGGGVSPIPTPELQSKSVSFDTNGDYEVLPDTGYDGLSKVEVKVATEELKRISLFDVPVGYNFRGKTIIFEDTDLPLYIGLFSAETRWLGEEHGDYNDILIGALLDVPELGHLYAITAGGEAYPNIQNNVLIWGDNGDIDIEDYKTYGTWFKKSFTFPDDKDYIVKSVEDRFDTAPEGMWTFRNAYVLDLNIEPTPKLQNKTLNFDSNGNFPVRPDAGFGGLSTVDVNIDVPTPEPDLQSKSVSFNSNGDYSVTSDPEYDGLSTVHVEVYIPPSGEPYLQPLNLDLLAYPGLSEHYQYEPGMYGADGFSEVHVDIQGAVPHLQEKSEDITDNGQYTIDFDEPYDGLNKVNINVDVPQAEPLLSDYSASFIADPDVPIQFYDQPPAYPYTGWGNIEILIEPFGSSLDEQADFWITQNGTYEQFPPNGIGFRNAFVDVNVEPKLQEKTIDIDANGKFSVRADPEYDGLENIDVNVAVSGADLQEIYYKVSKSDLNLFNIIPDSGYDGISVVHMDVPVLSDGAVYFQPTYYTPYDPYPGIVSHVVKIEDIDPRYIAFDELIVDIEPLLVDIEPQKTEILTKNHTYADLYAQGDALGIQSAYVEVDIPYEEKIVDIKSNGTFTFTPGEDFDAMSSITINVNVSEG